MMPPQQTNTPTPLYWLGSYVAFFFVGFLSLYWRYQVANTEVYAWVHLLPWMGWFAYYTENKLKRRTNLWTLVMGYPINRLSVWSMYIGFCASGAFFLIACFPQGRSDQLPASTLWLEKQIYFFAAQVAWFALLVGGLTFYRRWAIGKNTSTGRSIGHVFFSSTIAFWSFYQIYSLGEMETVSGSALYWLLFSCYDLVGYVIVCKVCAEDAQVAGLQAPPPANQPWLWWITYWTLLVLSNLVVVYYIALGGYVCTAGVLFYPVTFLLTDVLTECYHVLYAKWAIRVGLWTLVVFVLLSAAMHLIPGVPSEMTQHMQQLWGFMPAAFIASCVAYWSAQHVDIYLFDQLRALSKGRYLWLRNNAATILSEALDTAVYSLIFYMVWPYVIALFSKSLGASPFNWAAAQEVFELSTNEFGIKVCIALLDTPILYGIRRYMQGGRKKRLDRLKNMGSP